MPRTSLQSIAREALAIEQEQARVAGALGYTARLLIQAAMPHPLALDIYCWLTCRASDLREPTEIPLPALALQFGAAYTDPCRFRESILRQVTGGLRLYPAAHVSEGEHGLVLSPVAP